jgi:receptor protein-tyrosine kinase
MNTKTATRGFLDTALAPLRAPRRMNAHAIDRSAEPTAPTRDPAPDAVGPQTGVRPADNAAAALWPHEPVGRLADLRRKTPDGWVATSDPAQGRRHDTLRALRTELMLRRESTEQGDVIALLSPGAGEGRSLLLAELAMAFARTGHTTLLVDADLRRPQQHLLFGLPNDRGLAQAIEFEEHPLLCSVQGLARLSVISAGLTMADPLELLSSQRFAALMHGWRENFEFVLVDTAPAGRFSEGLAVAHLAGRVLVLSRAQHTASRDMADMLRRLSSTRAQILGAVVNHF